MAAILSASSCSTSGLPSALSVAPQVSAPPVTVQISWFSTSCAMRISGLCRSLMISKSDIVQASLISSIAGRDVVIGRRDRCQERINFGTTGVPRKIAAGEGVVAIIVQVLQVVVGDAVSGCCGRMTSGGLFCGRIDAHIEGRLFADLDPVLAECVVEAASRGIGQGIE